jgi:Tfp pilus assembly protein PilX
MKRPPHRLRGTAQLEFALGVAVACAVLALALTALTRLQSLGHEAQRVSQANEQAAASAVRQAHCELVPDGTTPLAPDCQPCPIPKSATLPSGTAASASVPSRSCP